MLATLVLFISIVLFVEQKFIWSLVLFVFLVTNGLQLVPFSILTYGIPLSKGTDIAIIYVLIITLLKSNILAYSIKNLSVFKYLVYLIVFVFVDFLISFSVLNNSFLNSFQVFRQFLILLCFVPFFVVPNEKLKKIFNFLAFISLLQSILFVSQIFTNKVLLYSSGGDENVTTSLVGSYTRFYNLPSFLVPSLIYFLFVYRFKSKMAFLFTNSILLSALIGPLHRSQLLSIIVCFFIYYLFVNRKAIVGYFSFGVFIFLFSAEVLNKRVSEAFNDINALFNAFISLKALDQTQNTLVFRIAHFLERFEYILNKPLGWLFGIGLMSDNSEMSLTLPFSIGLPSLKTGDIIKIDSSDLIYSPLILNLGIVGTCLYIFVFISFLFFFFNNFRFSNYAKIGFIVVLNSFFISFAGVEMLNQSFRVMVILLLVIVYKDSSQILKRINHK